MVKKRLNKLWVAGNPVYCQCWNYLFIDFLMENSGTEVRFSISFFESLKLTSIEWNWTLLQIAKPVLSHQIGGRWIKKNIDKKCCLLVTLTLQKVKYRQAITYSSFADFWQKWHRMSTVGTTGLLFKIQYNNISYHSCRQLLLIRYNRIFSL